MNHKTRTLIREIQTRIKNPITGQKEFANDDAVIDFAIGYLYEDLKKKRVLSHSFGILEYSSILCYNNMVVEFIKMSNTSNIDLPGDSVCDDNGTLQSIHSRLEGWTDLEIMMQYVYLDLPEELYDQEGICNLPVGLA